MAESQPVDPSVVDLARLRAWMDERRLGSGDISDLTVLAGGTQNLLLRFEREGRLFVLRRPPEHKRRNSDETMRREARVLGALTGSAVPHPQLIAAEPDEDVLGAAFYLMEAVDGFAPTMDLPDSHHEPAVQWAMGMSFVDALVALGEVDYLAVGLDGFGRPDDYLQRQVPRWQAHLDSYSELDGYLGPDIPHLAEIADWLERNRPLSFTPGIIHGDYHLGNVMFRNDRADLAAIVDWELATIGDPLIDVGLIMAMWPAADRRAAGPAKVEPWRGFPDIDDLVNRYRELSSRDLSAIEWYGVLACYKTGIILEGTHARAQAGKAAMEFGNLLHATTVALFERGAEIIARS